MGSCGLFHPSTAWRQHSSEKHPSSSKRGLSPWDQTNSASDAPKRQLYTLAIKSCNFVHPSDVCWALETSRGQDPPVRGRGRICLLLATRLQHLLKLLAGCGLCIYWLLESAATTRLNIPGRFRDLQTHRPPLVPGGRKLAAEQQQQRHHVRCWCMFRHVLIGLKVFSVALLLTRNRFDGQGLRGVVRREERRLLRLQGLGSTHATVQILAPKVCWGAW